MFDLATEAFLEGQFQVTIDSTRNDDDSYTSTFVAPDGTTVKATAPDRQDAHRQVSQLIREGVLAKTLCLQR